MNIPNGCEACPRLKQIRDRPQESFFERIEKATGSPVSQYSPYGPYYPPNYIMLEDGSVPDHSTVDVAWITYIRERDEKLSSVDSLVTDCPGMLDATVEVNGTTTSIEVCGKLALESIT